MPFGKATILTDFHGIPRLLKAGMDSGEKVRHSQMYFCAAKTVKRIVELFLILAFGLILRLDILLNYI